MKACTKCGELKQLDLFPRSKKAKDGRDTRCKACAAAHVRAYTLANPEKAAASARASQARNRHKRVDYYKAWCEANRDKVNANNRAWRENNYERAREIEQASYEKHREALIERKKAYRLANKHKWSAYAMQRKAARLRATPAWANPAAIEAIYAECARITKETGIVHHVDHIIPLQGRNVTGLHVESNLRVLEATANKRKANKLEEAFA